MLHKFKEKLDFLQKNEKYPLKVTVWRKASTELHKQESCRLNNSSIILRHSLQILYYWNILRVLYLTNLLFWKFYGF